jgi:hypothetical protein
MEAVDDVNLPFQDHDSADLDGDPWQCRAIHVLDQVESERGGSHHTPFGQADALGTGDQQVTPSVRLDVPGPP